MSNTLKEIDIKNCAYYFFDDMINIRNLDQNKINQIRCVTVNDLT